MFENFHALNMILNQINDSEGVKLTSFHIAYKTHVSKM